MNITAVNINCRGFSFFCLNIIIPDSIDSCGIYFSNFKPGGINGATFQIKRATFSNNYSCLVAFISVFPRLIGYLHFAIYCRLLSDFTIQKCESTRYLDAIRLGIRRGDRKIIPIKIQRDVFTFCNVDQLFR